MDIKQSRKDQGITQMALAVKVGVSLLTIQLWEKGVTTPTDENYKKLLAALGVLPYEEE